MDLVTRAALAAVGLTTVYAYLRFYTTPCAPADARAVLAVHAAECTPGLLAERRPVLIQDHAARPEADLPATVFRGMHVRADPPRDAAGCRVSHARFTLLFDPAADPGHVEIRHPARGEQEAVRVRMRRGQTLVLPPGWVFTAPPGVRELRLHSLFTLVFLGAWPIFPGGLAKKARRREREE